MNSVIRAITVIQRKNSAKRRMGHLHHEIYSGDPRERRMFRSAPDFFQQLVEARVVTAELGADEGVEVVRAEEGFRPFGEILLGVRERVVPLLGAADAEDRLVRAARAGIVVRLPD